MNNIGTKIKELRKRADLTQEQLADILGVSNQTVSKWECGTTVPDMSMIAPIVRFFKISADELFGLSESESDERKRNLRNRWESTWDTGDISLRYSVAKEANAEFPGNHEFLIWLADGEMSFADYHHKEHSEEWTSLYESSVRHYETLIESCSDQALKNDALNGIVKCLRGLDRNDEAVKYAKMHPTPEELLKWCLKGEEAEINIQNLVMNDLFKLVFDLEWRKMDLNCLKASEKIIKTVIDDGNYLWYHSWLMTNCIWQAHCYTAQGQFGEAVEYLRRSYYHAVRSDEIHAVPKGTALPYTCAILNKVTYAPDGICRSGMTTYTQDFKEYLSRDWFDPLRDRKDFRELLALRISRRPDEYKTDAGV